MHRYMQIFIALIPLSNGLEQPCNTLVESLPWHISWLMVRTALPSCSTGSSIQFHINDTNIGLELDTRCRGTMPVGSGLKPEDASSWVPCEDKRVRFLYQPEYLQIARSYIDDWHVSRLLCSPSLS